MLRVCLKGVLQFRPARACELLCIKGIFVLASPA